MPERRICSLVPAATEILFDLGLGELVVGVSHECDWPPEAAARPRLTASLLETDELTSAEIDEAVGKAIADGKPLYAVDEALWEELRPDTAVVQELCEVCAVSGRELERALRPRRLDVELLLYRPTTLGGILDSIRELGGLLGAEAAAAEVAQGAEQRLSRVEAALASVETRPRAFVCEWLEPPYVAGHWVPDMVAAAGGIDVAGFSGEPSYRLRWTDVAGLSPEVVVLAPCGFDLDRALAEVSPIELSAHLLGTSARQESRVFAVDAAASFSRPGPRVVDGVELLAFLLHPEAFSDPGVLAWSRVRL